MVGKQTSKIGRNDPCWCGSGLKYKKCHLGREDMERPNPHLIEQKLRKPFSEKYCLHPDAKKGLCQGNIIKAHTVQRSGGLSKIAEKGHVYRFNFELSTLIENEGLSVPKLIGIKQASTFTGFCKYHDFETFNRIESQAFDGNEEQTFLLAYRALCRELFTKRAAFQAPNFIREFDKGVPLNGQLQIQSLVNLNQIGLAKSLREMEKRKIAYDKCLTDKDYGNVNYYILRLDKTPDILCSGGFNPHYDFNGNMLQDYLDLSITLESMYFSLIPTQNGGAAILSWVEEGGSVCNAFVKSLNGLNRNEMPYALTRLVFEHFENTFFSPAWWSSLKESEKVRLIDRFASGALQKRSPNCLVDDGLCVVDWEVVSVETNMKLNS